MHAKLLAGTCPWCGRWIADGAPVAKTRPEDSAEYQLVKRTILEKLLAKLDLSRVADLQGSTLRREIRLVVERLCDCMQPPVAKQFREKLINEILDEVFH